MAEFSTYVVKEGDSLSVIAQKVLAMSSAGKRDLGGQQGYDPGSQSDQRWSGASHPGRRRLSQPLCRLWKGSSRPCGRPPRGVDPELRHAVRRGA